MILATSYEVLARYLFDSPTIWAYEVGYMLTGSHFLLAMAFALREGQHIRIDIFSGHFSQRTRAMIDLAGYAVLLPLTVWLTLALTRHFWTGYANSEKSGQSALNMPVWPANPRTFNPNWTCLASKRKEIVMFVFTMTWQVGPAAQLPPE